MCRGDHWSPASLVQQRVFQESIFTENRARVSNARPYKSFWQPDRCIVAVAEYVDRHRRRGVSEEKIRRKLIDQSGTRFDPAGVQAMLEIV